MTITETTVDPYDDIDDDAADTGRTGRAAFLAGLRHDRYPVVPEALSVAVSALEHADELSNEVRRSKPLGMGPFCQQVAADVLAGKPYPTDFGAAAYQATQAAARLDAQSIAAATVSRQLHDQFAGVITECLPELLDGLRAQLGELLIELHDVDTALGGLDIEDPAAVAAASSKQRSALVSLDGLRRRYNSLRRAQRAALEASSVSVPGTTPLSVGHTWQHVFDRGLHEFSDPGQHGLPPAYLKQIPRLRGLAARPDVWLPSTDELRAAWDLHAPPPGQGVVHWDFNRPTSDDHEGSTAS